MSQTQQHAHTIGIYSQNSQFLQRFGDLVQQIGHRSIVYTHSSLAHSHEKLWIVDLEASEVEQVLRRLLQQAKDILVVAHISQSERVIRAIYAGATACTLSERDDAEIMVALRSWGNGEAPIDPAITRQLLASLLQQLPQQHNITALVESEIELTNREKQILQLVAEGLSNQQIATQLYLSRHTVDSHVKHIYRKLEVTKRMRAVSTARHLGLL